MRQDQVLEIGRGDLLGHVGGGVIGQMSMPAQNALFGAPGAPSIGLQEMQS